METALPLMEHRRDIPSSDTYHEHTSKDSLDEMSESDFDELTKESLPRYIHESHHKPNRTPKHLLTFSVILNGFLIGLVFYLLPKHTRSRLPPFPLDVYSPADEAISYETKVFDDNFHGSTKYSQPTEEADKAWSSLYKGLLYLTIPTTSANLLPNTTSAHPRDPTKSLIGIDVFHQLHCLDMIRRSLHPDRYNTTDPGQRLHTAHCVDSIRQSLMCSADVSTILFQWSEARNWTLPNGQVTHTCRNWDRLVDWATEHKLKTVFDPREKAEGAPIGDEGIDEQDRFDRMS